MLEEGNGLIRTDYTQFFLFFLRIFWINKQFGNQEKRIDKDKNTVSNMI